MGELRSRPQAAPAFRLCDALVVNTPLIRHFPPLRALGLVASLIALSAAPAARASLLVYEGFNGYTTGVLEGQLPNAGSTIGLDTSVAYYDGTAPSRAAGYTIQSTGLTLGSLQTSGGALAFTNATTNVIGADLAIGATAFTGTLWSSYLVNLSLRGGASNDGAAVRIGTTPSDSNGGHFNSWADSRPTTASTTVSVSYGATPLSTTNGTAALTLNTTYIIINSYTRVGQSLSAGTPGVAKLWALNQSQYAAFLAAGGTETALDSISVTATATSSLTSGSLSFSSNDAFGLVTVNDSGVYDELRFGASLADVTPTAIPEPAALAAWLGAVGGLSALTLRRRR